MIYKLSDFQVSNHDVKIVEILFTDPEIITKFQNIGICLNEVIKVVEFKSNKDLLIFESNEVRYGIRRNDAKNILVKKVY